MEKAVVEVAEAKRVVAKSEALCSAASALMPGGLVPVSGSWNAGSMSSIPADPPPVAAKAKGATLTDVDGNEYVDYIGGHGAMILGHADERVVAAISKAAAKGYTFGAPSGMEVRLAELIAGRFPPIDMVRVVNTPAEALNGAVALARAYTGRDMIVTFNGRHARAGLSTQDSRTDTAAQAPSYGPIPSGTLPYNDVEGVEALFAESGSLVAAVVVEPVGTRPVLTPAADGFLTALRSLCDAHHALLVFDETINGLRTAPGGAGALYEIAPDLILLGPIIGGGLPLAAYAGRKDVMQRADAGALRGQASGSPGTERTGVYQSGMPCSLLAMAAGIATLQVIGEPGFYEALEEKAKRFDEGLRAATGASGMPARHTRVASMVAMRLLDETPGNDLPTQRETARFARYHREMLVRGILLPPSPTSCMFVSSAHSEGDIDRTIEAAHDVLRRA